jgi:DNA-binding NtrC family response regulator
MRTLVLDDDEDLCFLLCEVVSLSGGECLPVQSLDDLVARESEALSCDLALLDVNLGADLPSGLDAFEWLRAHDFQGRIVFLTGHARTHPLVVCAQEKDGVPVFEKPVSFDTLMSLLSDSRRE